MDLVDEDDGPGAVLARPLGIGHHLLDFLDAGQHRGKFDELGVGHARDDFGQRGFADARRSPEEQRAGVVTLDLDAQGLAGSEDVLLADKLIERARTHAIGQRARLVDDVIGRDLREEIHKVVSPRRHGEHGVFRDQNHGASNNPCRIQQIRTTKHLKDSSHDASPQKWHIEINQQSDVDSAQPQIGQ